MADFRFSTPEMLDEALCLAVSERLKEAVALRGCATLVLSGGSTPRALYQQLAQTPLRWDCVTVLLADERWVASDHEDSNEGMLRRLLLQGEAASAHFLSLCPGYPDVQANLKIVEAQVSELPPFDAVLLGMGLDRHTASLFPCSEQIAEAMATSASVVMTRPTTAPHRRLSLSRTRLANCRWGALHIVGDDKVRVLKAMEPDAPAVTAPVSAFLPPRGSFEVWRSP